jgi:hypothetical protein
LPSFFDTTPSSIKSSSFLRRVSIWLSWRLAAVAVHLLRELPAEFVKEIRPKQLLLQRVQHSAFDFLTRNCEAIVARPAVARAEAAEVRSRVDDEAGTAHATLRQA